MHNYRFYSVLVISIIFGQSLFAQGTQLLRQPTISADKVVFAYADDLWIADRAGGDAVRLTSNEGSEISPHFSQDGKWIAFSAEYGGNMDVYVVSSDGGHPDRLTWHPGYDAVQGWTPEGTVVFRSGRMGHPTETNSLYEIDPQRAFPEPLHVTRAAYGEVSPDGKYLAYTPITSWDPEWRNYRGGQAMPIWIQDLQSGALKTTPQKDKERHLDPVWIGSKIYYLSERDYVSNIWSYDMATDTEEQITFHKVFDIKSLDAHGSDIVYEQGGYLHMLTGASGPATQLRFDVKGDMNFAMERWEQVQAYQLNGANLSPNGKRAIFEHRGEIFTVPAKKGSVRHITSSSDVADRTPIWSPKGDKIAWFSDASGEYKLIIADQYGKVEKEYSGPGNTFYFVPDWSADGSKIAFSDTHYNIWYIDLGTGIFTKVDTDRYAHPNRTMNPKWSPDSRYIVYPKQQDSHFKSVFIYDTETKQKHHVVDGLADVVTPVFDQSGEYLYYLASTDYGLASGWLDMSSYDPSVSRTLYVTVLQKDGKSPLLLESDDEKVTDSDEEEGDENDRKNSDEDDEETAEDEEEKVQIDFDGIQSRVVAVRDVSGAYEGLERGPEGHVFVWEIGEGGADLSRYSFEDQELTLYSSGVNAIRTSADGSKVLLRSGDRWSISGAAGKPNPTDDGLKMNIKLKVDPQAEYKQIFKEGWRYMRDFLYVDNVHGAPWDKVWEWYSPWIDHVRHRTDLNYVIDIMSGEVAIGHSYVSGGDFPDKDRVGVGLLGADYKLENGLYKIDKIYNGENWNPQTVAPLSQPGLDVSVGDYITAVNGKSVTAQDNIYEFFEETAGKQVKLTLKSSMTAEERHVVIEPTRSERSLRTVDWMEANRRKVDELSNGQLAYVYVPNTSGAGFTNFNRYYFSQQDKKGVIIDERNNGGGSAADYMIDIMGRELVGYFNSKAGDNRPWTTPIAGIWGPKVMIINERAGSGGDLLPYMFKAKNIGPLVGTRTWGGLVGTWDTPPFIDGGRMVAPRGGFYDVDGNWAVEGEGIAPDIEVIMDPVEVLQGKDPQLEAAVMEALRLLQADPFEMKPEPAAPIRSKRPSGWDKQ